MNNRTIEIKVRLNQKEAAVLNEKVEKSGLSREAYLRQLINGLSPLCPPKSVMWLQATKCDYEATDKV